MVCRGRVVGVAPGQTFGELAPTFPLPDPYTLPHEGGGALLQNQTPSTFVGTGLQLTAIWASG